MIWGLWWGLDLEPPLLETCESWSVISSKATVSVEGLWGVTTRSFVSLSGKEIFLLFYCNIIPNPLYSIFFGHNPLYSIDLFNNDFFFFKEKENCAYFAKNEK